MQRDQPPLFVVHRLDSITSLASIFEMSILETASVANYPRVCLTKRK